MSSLFKKVESIDSQLRVAILIACHNRKPITIRCLESLYAAKPENWDFKIYLVDDGSTDGTSEAVQKFDRKIHIIKGDGNWFWAHSMYQAEMAIVEPYDAILWLNDDTVLYEDSLKRLDYFTFSNPSAILVGQFRSSSDEAITYGGYVKYDRHPFHFRRTYSDSHLRNVDTFNGNFVFVPNSISKKVGRIDGTFAHAYADIDYGLRAKKLGVTILTIPGFIGTCDTNPVPNFSSLADKLSFLMGNKSSPVRSQIRFLKRHGGFTWPIYFLAPFIKLFSKSLAHSMQVSKTKKGRNF